MARIPRRPGRSQKGRPRPRKGQIITPEQIRNLRTNAGLSQKSVADFVKVTQGTISNWESGKSAPSETQAQDLRGLLTDSEVDPSLDPSHSPQANYGEWLSRTRSEKGMSRTKLAAEAGVSSLQIWNIETGRTTNPRATTREKLEGALGTKTPTALQKAIEKDAEIASVGQFTNFDPHDESDFPDEPGVYVFYDISDRPVYVGQSSDIRDRIRNSHQDKFWYRPPIVETASYVRVDDKTLRTQLEATLIKFLKSNAVINKQQVLRG